MGLPYKSSFTALDNSFLISNVGLKMFHSNPNKNIRPASNPIYLKAIRVSITGNTRWRRGNFN